MTEYAAISVLLCGVVCGPAPVFDSSRIVLDEDVQSGWTEDFDGDGRRDLIVAVHSAARGRELLVFLQSASGRFPAQPTSRVEIKRDIVAFDMADVRDEPGVELLFWTRSGCFGYSTSRSGYVGNARRLLHHDLLTDVPSRKDISRLRGAMDLDGDGRPEIVAPGPHGFGIFARSADAADASGFTQRSLVRLDVHTRKPESTRRNRVVVGVGVGGSRPNTPEHLRDLVIVKPAADGGSGVLLAEDRWLPALLVRELDGDGRLDVLVARDRRIEVRLQDATGRYPATPSWTGEIAGDGPIWCVDVDGDGLDDLIAGDSQAKQDATLRFYRHRGATFFAAQPDQAMRFSGYGVQPKIVDIDADGNAELVVSSFAIPVTGALGGGRVDRTLLIYRSEEPTSEADAPNARRLFARRPAGRYEESFTAKEFKGLGQRITFDADLTGTGRRDAVLVERDGAIVARRVTDAMEIESQPFWRFLPERWILEVDVDDLDGDGISDFVLRHHRGFTVLVSR